MVNHREMMSLRVPIIAAVICEGDRAAHIAIMTQPRLISALRFVKIWSVA